jgi:hypothetical protein
VDNKNSRQISFSFEAGLLERFPNFMDCVRASVYGCGRAAKAVAADLDMSLSEFSRKLADNPNDNVNFPMALLPALVAATGDMSPVHWLTEKLCETPESRKERLMADLQQQMRRVDSVLAALEA